MIHRFTFSNFYSFYDEQTIDFTVNEKAPNTEAYVESAFGTRVGKLLVCFGHNASGKTNLLKPFVFLSWFITHSFQQEPDREIPFVPFFFPEDPSAAGKFSVDFELNRTLFRYRVALTKERVLEEQLSRRNESDARFSYVFRRRWCSDSGEYEVTTNRAFPSFRLPDAFHAPRNRQNASLLSVACQASDPLSQEIVDYWTRRKTNVAASGRRSPELLKDVLEASRFFNKHSAHFGRADAILREFDLGLRGLGLIPLKTVDEDGIEQDTVLAHAIHGDPRSENHWFMPLFYESGGTTRLFVHLSRVLPVLSEGSIAVLDELESDLHPLMIPKVLDLFIGRETNPRNAQLICSCHSAPVMNHLDKYQILLVEKDEDLKSHAWRLDEMKGVRADDNYFAKYMAGAYGAVPDFT